MTKSHVIRKTILVKGTINHQKWTKKKKVETFSESKCDGFSLKLVPFEKKFEQADFKELIGIISIGSVFSDVSMILIKVQYRNEGENTIYDM